MKHIAWKGWGPAIGLLLIAAGCAERPKESLPAGQPSLSSLPASSVSKRAPKALTPRAAPRPAPASSPPLLSPDPTGDQQEQDAWQKIELAEQLVTHVNQTQLTKEQRDTFLTIQNFLSKAKEALAVNDLPRALTLAQKAHTLAAELPTTPQK